jgi:hypothetical protein
MGARVCRVDGAVTMMEATVSSAMDLVIGRLLDYSPRLSGKGWRARCPAHDDSNPSLSVRQDAEGRPIIKCHAGCTTEAILAALGLNWNLIFGRAATGTETGERRKREVSAYRYVDESDNLLFEVVRYDPKGFRQRRPDGAGRYRWVLDGVRRVLYRLPEITEAVALEKTIFVVEGEKDVEALRAINLIATTNPQGAGKWRPEYSDVLAGARVAIIPDNDDAGRAHADEVARSLRAVGATAAIVQLPDLRSKGDVSDWLESVGTGAELQAIADAALSNPSVSEQPPSAQVTSNGDNDRSPAPIMTMMSSVVAEEVQWLWRGRIPFGKLTVLDGDPGLGKSTIMLDVAARLTRGAAMPDGTAGTSGNVVLASAEDGLADTIHPRLVAAGADLDRVHALRGVRVGEHDQPLTLPDDAHLLERAIREARATLAIVDPIMAFLNPHVDAHKDQHVRRALAALAAVAERTGAAIVLVRHLNKAAQGNALYRGAGSIGIAGAARSVLVVAKDPADDSRRILAQVKSNLAAPVASLGFVLESTDSGSRVRWIGERLLSADELLAAQGATGDERSALADAVGFLREALNGGPRSAKELELEATKVEIRPRTLRRARETLGVISHKSGPNYTAEWRLREEVGQLDHPGHAR